MYRKVLHFMSIRFLLPLLLLPVLMVQATESEIKTLTLGQAINLALESNLSLKQSTNQIALGKIGVQRAKANFYPDLNASGRATESYDKSLNSSSGQYDAGHSGSVSISADSTFNLFNGFYDIASLQQSKLELQAINKNLERTRQAIIFEAISRFIGVVTAQELITVEQGNLKAQQQLLGQVEDFYKSGRRPVTDFYQQNAEISQAEYRLLEAERNYNVFKLQLLQFLGLQPNINYNVVDPGLDTLTALVAELDKDALVKEALQNRTDITAQNLLIQAAGKEIKVARSGYWPKLSLFAGLGSSYSDMNKSANFSHQLFDNNLSGHFGLSLSIPVFDKFRTRYNVASAIINLENQHLEMEKLTRQVSVEVQQAIEDYGTAGKQMDVAENQLKYSTSALESIQERYNVNAATMTELTQVRATYLQSSYNRVTARFNLLLRGIAVAFYRGDSQAMMAYLNK